MNLNPPKDVQKTEKSDSEEGEDPETDKDPRQILENSKADS